MKKIILILVSTLFLGISLFVYIRIYSKNDFRILFFDVGQGDSALINFENGEKMLIDCGPDNKILYKLGKYLPFWDRKIDYLVISHFDLDHYGGCVDVLKRYKVSQVIENGMPGTDEYYYSFKEILENNKMIATKIISGYEKDIISSSTIEFLWPLSSVKIGGDNNNSVVLKITNASTTVLFTGDLEIRGEEEILKKYCFNESNHFGCQTLKAEILKIGHHGSSGSSSEEFLQAVSPKFAIISVGENKFDHPSLRVLNKLERLGLTAQRTDMLGDILK